MNRPAILAMALAGALARADVVDIHLDIAPLRIHPSGRPAEALAINGVIPGPVLRFREGDTARIRVRNACRTPPPPSTGTACSCPTPRTAFPT
jgi:FtsP/CotA-like multicopper oxidase with cupredoxin domain